MAGPAPLEKKEKIGYRGATWPGDQRRRDRTQPSRAARYPTIILLRSRCSFGAPLILPSRHRGVGHAGQEIPSCAGDVASAAGRRALRSLERADVPKELRRPWRLLVASRRSPSSPGGPGGHGAAVDLTLRDRTVVRWYLCGSSRADHIASKARNVTPEQLGDVRYR
jgi:hypothetical protein